MGFLIFAIFNIIDLIAIFITGALASAIPVTQYNYYALAQNILIGAFLLSWIIAYIVLCTAADLKDKKRKRT